MAHARGQPIKNRLLRYDGAVIIPTEAAERARVSLDTAVRWARLHGVAYQAGGRGSPWRIHPVGWHLVVKGDLETLADLRDGNLTPAVADAFREKGMPLPDLSDAAA